MRRKKSWLGRLSTAARWRLGAKEAGEVIADYREIVGGPPRTEEELVRDLGKPQDAVKPLTDQKAYRLWLAVFAVMAGCILAMGISPWDYVLWEWLFARWPFGIQPAPIVAVAGTVTALVWSRRCGEKRGRLSKAIPVLLAVCLVLIAGVMLFSWACVRDLDGFRDMWGEMPALLGPARMVSVSSEVFRYMLSCSPPLLALAGVFSLVKARMGDRRWAAVYVLAMTAMLVSLEVLAVISYMDYDPPADALAALARQVGVSAAITALGLTGTGVALC